MKRRGVKPRTIGILFLIILSLSILLYGVYDDREYIKSDNEFCKITILEKDNDMIKMCKIIDSLKDVKKRIDTVFLYREHKKAVKMDSVIRLSGLDSLRADSLRADSLRADSLK